MSYMMYHTESCGCKVLRGSEGLSPSSPHAHVVIDYCPKHNAAPAMYEALQIVTPWAKEWIKYLRINIGPGQGQEADKVFAAISEVLNKGEVK